MKNSNKPVLALALALSLRGCMAAPQQSNWHFVNFKQNGPVETTIDPISGDFVRTVHWIYDDGVEKTTTDTIHPGEDIERRRGENLPRPEKRLVD